MVLSPLGHDTALFYTVLASSLELGPVGGGGAGWPPRAPGFLSGRPLENVSLTQASSGALAGDSLCHSNSFIKAAEGRNNPTSRQLEADRCYSF